jgi:hypothetical protein
MEYSTPGTALLQAQASNPILGNPLLLAAILLFLAILPRALRHILSQKEKTALDRMVEQFEEEELKTTAEEESNENNTQQEKPVPPKDSSLAYLKEDLPTPQETQEDEGTPPFPIQEEDEKKVKIIKEGVPISHNKAEDSSPAPKKKVKLIKQEISIAPDKSKISSKKALSEPLKSKAPVQGRESKADSKESPASEHENEESDGNWIEAEIPGLIMNPSPATERSESVPTFKASPKAKHQSEAEKPQKSPQIEKQSVKVKNIAPKSEEIKDSKPKKQVKTKTDSPELKIEISESKPKLVEIKAPIVSHKNIVKKGAGQKKTKAPSAKAGKTQKTEPELTKVLPQREDTKISPEKGKPKPFLLDLKYLDQEELETVDPVAHEELPADIMDVVIARLNALQVDLENQLVSIPGEPTANENSINGNMRKDRVQDSLPDLEETLNDPSDKKEVSLEELDSFLFTATQRKNRE